MLNDVVVGSGYRAEYFGRVARTWPELFRACYLCRSEKKAARMRAAGADTGASPAGAQDCAGHVMSDVTAMRGEVTGVEPGDDFAAMTALVSVASSMDYARRLAQSTNGRGGMSARLHSCRECPWSWGATADRRSVDPLDTSKYILAARSAMEGGIFDLDG